jgi:hypothetical protein
MRRMIHLFLLDVYDVQSDRICETKILHSANLPLSFITHTHEAESGPANKHACRCNSKAASTRRALNYRWAPTTGTTGLGGVADKARGRQVIELQVRRSNFSMHETRERKRNNKKRGVASSRTGERAIFIYFIFNVSAEQKGGGVGGRLWEPECLAASTKTRKCSKAEPVPSLRC